MTGLFQQFELFKNAQSEIKCTAKRRDMEKNLSFPCFFSVLVSRSVAFHLIQAKQESRDNNNKKSIDPKSMAIYGRHHQ